MRWPRRDARCVVAPDWRGFGLHQRPAGTDAYWFADYLGDLDALLDACHPTPRSTCSATAWAATW
jgi:pimeloyl-ACP methyl ester carboxylesterase